MRNAVAHLDEDLAFDEPTRKAKTTRPRTVSAKKRGPARSKPGKMRYAHYAAIGLSATVAIGIMVNALVMQHSRHPAPLFGDAIQLGDKPVALAAATPGSAPQRGTPAPAAAEPLDQTASLPPAAERQPLATDGLPPAANAVPIPVQRPRRAAPDVAPASKARLDDPIAKLLKASGAKPSEKADDKDNTKTVIAAQRALMKLGFVVKPNGSFGPATHAALEAFERDQHLPVKGDLSRKVLKQLSVASGVPID